MEKALTMAKMLGLLEACEKWKEDVCLMTDEDSYQWVSDWMDHLKHISYEYQLPVNLAELYAEMNDLCIALNIKMIELGRCSNGLS